MVKTIYSREGIFLMGCVALIFLCSAKNLNSPKRVDEVQLVNTKDKHSLHLSAKCNFNVKGVFLSWDSCMSSQVKYEVYKSIDSGKTWILLVQKDGKEPTQINGKYSVLDQNPVGLSWYKLQVVDLNSKTLASEISSADYSVKYPSMLKSFQARPPLGNFSFSVKQKTEFTVVDKNGKCYKFGTTQSEVVVDGLPDGLYYLNLIGPNHIETYNVLIQ